MSSKAGKLAACIFLVGASLSLLFHHASVDVFAPIHVSIANNSAENGFIIETLWSKHAPASTAYGVVFLQVTGFSSFGLLFFPILLVPYGLALFALTRYISSSNVVGSLVVLADFSAGTHGSGQLTFWPHGFGNVMLWAALLCILIAVKYRHRVRELMVILLVLGSGLVYMSYSRSGILIIFLLIFSIFGMFLQSRDRSSQLSLYPVPPQAIFIIAVTFIVIHLSLHSVFYEGFLPRLVAPLAKGGSPIELFQAQFLGESNSPLEDLLLNRPGLVTPISIVRYGAILLALVAFLAVAIFAIVDAGFGHELFGLRFYFVFIFITTMALYSGLRIAIGQIPIQYAYYPGVITLCLLFYFTNLKLSLFSSSTIRIAVIAILCILTVTAIGNYAVYSSHGQIHNYKGDYDHSASTAAWTSSYQNTQSSRTDLTTYGLLQIHTTNGYEESKLDRYDLGDVEFLASRRFDNANHTPFYIMNWNLPYFSIGEWRNIQSWNAIWGEKFDHLGANKLYTSGGHTVVRPLPESP